MPGIWMHLEYGRLLEEEFGGSFAWRDGGGSGNGLYQLGCQGPDFLLYHSFWPWNRDTRAIRLGDQMHAVHCGPVLLEFWERTLALPPGEQREAQQYFLGFLTHHLLDRNLHPYINWKAGYRNRDHQRFEFVLDTVFMQSHRQFATWQHPAWSRISIGSGLPRSVRHILHDTASAWYPEAKRLPEDIWDEAYLDMVLAQKWLHDPKGWKQRLLPRSWQHLFYHPPTAAEERLDYLNAAHAQWRHSAMYSEVRTESVMDLWEAALAEGRIVLQALADWLNSAVPAEASRKRELFIQLLGDRSYDTGKECSSNLSNRYAEPIWESGISS
ncbi:zinc dependent phospholipase C family protein [Paenibacillus tepidiphilus]|uniref:zinc dependent phospholipase C family protein n=1 Tax=Paenibacillus tepidiphilus TaxID=2608683 RepID=UPI00123A3130|nr:zinc dependent phospholipase C family protein [Paenibacillus tepidiphilus]